MRLFVLGFWFAAALFFCARPLTSQNQPVAAAQDGNFFSGFVVNASATEITVNRRGLGKDTGATRTFTLDGNTRVEGSLKPKAHVTVRFVADEQGARAVHIIVR